MQGLKVEPQRIVYEMRGDVTRPGIYRYEQEQTPAALAAYCGAEHARGCDADTKVSSGTRLTFDGSGPAFTSMDAPVLLSYGLPLKLATASAEDLALVPGIGPKTARALIEYRESAGPVGSLEQLLDVRGIGPKTLEKIARHLRP